MTKSENFDFTIKGETGPVFDICPSYLGAQGGQSYPGVIPVVPENLEGGVSVGTARLAGNEADNTESVKPEEALSSLKNFGGALFASLFPNDIAGAFFAKLGSARDSGKALRIGIDLDAAPALARLPWEALYAKASDRFIGVDRHSNIVRLLSPRQLGEEPENLKPPVKVLIAIANPKGDLKASNEVRAISEHLTNTLGSQSLFTPTVIENVSQYRLNNAIYEHRPDILHFIGHGGFVEDAGILLLCAEDDPSQSAVLDTQALGDNLVNYPPRLVVLNSCQGATAAPRDRHAGTAQSLIGMNIPYVVAMQFPISDKAATAFSERFYAALADGDTIETSVTLGRSAVRSLSPAEFATPVLYSGSRQGGLLIERFPLSESVTLSAASESGSGKWRRWALGLVAAAVAAGIASITLNVGAPKQGGGETAGAQDPSPVLPPAEPGNSGSENPGEGPAAGSSGGSVRPASQSQSPAAQVPVPSAVKKVRRIVTAAVVVASGPGSAQGGQTDIPPPPAGGGYEYYPAPPPPAGGGYEYYPAPAPAPMCDAGPYLVFFDWDQSDLNEDYNADVITNAAVQYGNCGNVRIMLSGHADKSGASAYNVALAERRNAKVGAALIARGISHSLISGKSFGESAPIVQTADGVREPQNRRVEINFVPDQPTTGGE